MRVIEAGREWADKFIPQVHYSRRKGVTQKVFLLCDDALVVGAVTYGPPPRQIAKNALTSQIDGVSFFELTRLVVARGVANGASVLVGRSLKMLPPPSLVVSYADTAWGHSGIVYQATNWEYSGATVSHDSLYKYKGETLHPRTLASRGISNPKGWAAEVGAEQIPPQEKHRYFYFVGNRKQVKEMRAAFRYPLGVAYPKSEKTLYETVDFPTVMAPDTEAEWKAAGLEF